MPRAGRGNERQCRSCTANRSPPSSDQRRGPQRAAQGWQRERSSEKWRATRPWATCACSSIGITLEPVFEYDWDEANQAHIARHEISREEVEEALEGLTIGAGTVFRNGERRAAMVGATLSGRILFVVITVREQWIRVVTAYPAQPKMKAAYTEYMEKYRENN